MFLIAFIVTVLIVSVFFFPGRLIPIVKRTFKFLSHIRFLWYVFLLLPIQLAFLLGFPKVATLFLIEKLNVLIAFNVLLLITVGAWFSKAAFLRIVTIVTLVVFVFGFGWNIRKTDWSRMKPLVLIDLIKGGFHLPARQTKTTLRAQSAAEKDIRTWMKETFRKPAVVATSGVYNFTLLEPSIANGYVKVFLRTLGKDYLYFDTELRVDHYDKITCYDGRLGFAVDGDEQLARLFKKQSTWTVYAGHLYLWRPAKGERIDVELFIKKNNNTSQK